MDRRPFNMSRHWARPASGVGEPLGKEERCNSPLEGTVHRRTAGCGPMLRETCGNDKSKLKWVGVKLLLAFSLQVMKRASRAAF